VRTTGWNESGPLLACDRGPSGYLHGTPSGLVSVLLIKSSARRNIMVVNRAGANSVRCHRSALMSRGTRAIFLREKGFPERSTPKRNDSRTLHPGRRLGLSRLLGIVLHPINIILPIDHQHIFKTAVGAAKGSQLLREHVSRLLESWIVVGTLILGVSVGLLACSKTPLGVYPHSIDPADYTDSGTPSLRQLKARTGSLEGMGHPDPTTSEGQIILWTHWLFTIACYICCAASFLGPIILGAVLVNTTFACSVSSPQTRDLDAEMPRKHRRSSRCGDRTRTSTCSSTRRGGCSCTTS
jgi:hypothetical protein